MIDSHPTSKTPVSPAVEESPQEVLSTSKRSFVKSAWVPPVIIALSLPHSSYAKNVSGGKGDGRVVGAASVTTTAAATGSGGGSAGGGDGGGSGPGSGSEASGGTGGGDSGGASTSTAGGGSLGGGGRIRRKPWDKDEEEERGLEHDAGLSVKLKEQISAKLK